jgi:cytochrome P450
MLDIRTVTAGSSLSALISHAVFKRHEPTPAQFVGFMALFEYGLYWLCSSTQQKVWAVMLQCTLLYLGTLAASIGIYRLYLHPLREYPGPVLGKLTKFYNSYHCSRGRSHLWLEKLHAQYGETVRYGPNDLSIISPEDVAFIQGGRSTKLRRGPWYDGSPDSMKDSFSMARTRNVEVHKLRRRIWEQAFTQSALATYEPKVKELVDRVVAKCAADDWEVVDIKGEIDNFAFDAMGMLGFSRDYGMISGVNTESKTQIQALGDYMKMLGVTRPIPWFKSLYRMLPIDSKGKNGIHIFVGTTRRRFEERYHESGKTNDDILHYLVLPESKTGVQMTRTELLDEAISVVIAGSDTTSICLSFAFYYLLKYRLAYSKLVKEVDSLWDGHSPLGAKNLVPSRAPYLDGVINESLRLAEPDPNGNQRQTPKGGFTFNNRYIPEYTQLSVHKWSMQRYEKNFSKSHEFIPERWISDEERSRLNITRHNPNAFIPFGAGQYGCVGKQLALVEMRLFLVGLLRRLDFSPSPEYDLETFPETTTSHLTLITPPLPALIKIREY